MSNAYNAIVIGARCAGSPTGMLLARKGYRVLVVDRATFPSDTVSTHVLHPVGVSQLAKWGLLDRLTATGCPPIDTYAFDFGPFTLAGAPGTVASPVAYCPRRTVLDKLLLDAAVEAGAEVREGFTVNEVAFDNGHAIGIKGHSRSGRVLEERARVVIGADGRHSVIARAMQLDRYHEKPPLLAVYYSYWSGLPMHGRFETYIRPNRGCAAVQTHDGLTVVIAGWPHAEFEANRGDVEGNYLKVLDLAPGLADRVRQARREAPISGAAIPNFFRKPYGSGWALVGDAGYSKDPITAQGITDAFRDAEGLTMALDQMLSGAQPSETALAAHQRARDEQVLPMYKYTCQLATLAPPAPETQQLFAAVHGNQTSMDAFVQMNAGTISPAEFFAPANVARMMAPRPS